MIDFLHFPPHLVSVSVSLSVSGQSEEELHKMRLVLPQMKSPAAYLYNEELVYTCTTGTVRSGLPEEKLAFNASGTTTTKTVFLSHSISF